MAKIVLLHGFAVGLTSPVVRRPFGPGASFEVFNKAVEGGEAAVFSWGDKQQVGLFRLINPLFLRRFYQKEKKLAQDIETQKALNNFLIHEQPEIIISHSMGSFLLSKFLQKFSLPKSVRLLIFIQADVSEKTGVSPGVRILNLYCPWDPTLLVSTVLNHGWRWGLKKIKQENIENILFPLWRPPNLHTSSIRDKKLLELISQL